MTTLPQQHDSPILTAEEVYADAERVIARLAMQHTDPSCYALTIDELVSEGRLKLAQLISKGELIRQKTRQRFFRFFKASVNNHFRSLVQRHRFTAKRTGYRPPKRGVTDPNTETDFERVKHAEVRLDDDDLHLQVPDTSVDADMAACIEDYRHVLNPLECLVFDELHAPSAKARCWAMLDAKRGKRKSVRVEITVEHMARSVGLSMVHFEQVVDSIQRKITEHIHMSAEDQVAKARQSAAVQQLSAVYGVFVPPGMDPVTISRLFTIAARDQFEKITPQLSELLALVGAMVPTRRDSTSLECFGVLFSQTDRRCAPCDLRDACALKAANFGLGKMTLSPKLLASRSTRYPVASTTPSTALAELPQSQDILEYLGTGHKRAEVNEKVFYFHQDAAASDRRNRRPVFCLESVQPLRIRFCNPSKSMTEVLTGETRAWYPPENIDNDALIALMDRHSSEVFEQENQPHA